MCYNKIIKREENKKMTISEMKKILEELEAQGFGDMEVICGNATETGSTVEEVGLTFSDKGCIWWN
jgi:ATP-dependent protease HslVU (ClpYQ) ATPase subunit